MRLRKNDIVTARITAETKTELLNASSKYDLSQQGYRIDINSIKK